MPENGTYLKPYPLADISPQLRQPQPPKPGGELPRGHRGPISPAALPSNFVGRLLFHRSYILLIALIELPSEQRGLGSAAPFSTRSSGFPLQPDPGAERPGFAALLLARITGLAGKI